MDLGLKGKRALVLGGNRGIGQGIALALAREGAHVTITGRERQRLSEAVDEIKAGVRIGAGGASANPDEATGNGLNADKRSEGSQEIGARALDLGDTASLAPFAAALEAEFGPIDILVNNTGGPEYGGVSGRSAAAWTSAFNEMVLSVITLTDALLPGMRQRRFGRILTVVSSGVVQPIPVLGISNSLRSALIPWSKSLSIEVARDGVTSNILVPGRIDTERVRMTDEATAAQEGITPEQAKLRSTGTIPMGRYATTAEFGALAAFAASVPAGYITGSMLRCDGGNIRSI